LRIWSKQSEDNRYIADGKQKGMDVTRKLKNVTKQKPHKPMMDPTLLE